MWKRPGILGTLILGSVIGTVSAHAQPSDTRVAVVHFEDVVEASPGFGEASRRWSERLDLLTQEVQALQDEFKASEERLNGAIPPLVGAERTQLVASMEGLQAEIARRRSDVEPELNALRQSLLTPVVEALRDAVEQYARTEGFHIVIDSSNLRIPFLLADEEVDLTEEVIAAIGGNDSELIPEPEIPLLPNSPPRDGAPLPRQ